MPEKWDVIAVSELMGVVLQQVNEKVTPFSLAIPPQLPSETIPCGEM